jgi:hypothetical protein
MNMRIRNTLPYIAIALATAAGTLLVVRARAAGIPETDALTYTGYLESAEGAPLTGAHSIEVQFWDSAEAADSLCSGNAPDTELQSGRFQVVLPKSCADAVKASPDVWVDVAVDGASLGRTKLGAVPFALEAGHAVTATSANSATSADNATIADSAATADSADSASGSLADELDDMAAQIVDRPVASSSSRLEYTDAAQQTPPAGAQRLIHAGTCVVTTTAGGAGTCAYESLTFPNGVLSVVLSWGHTSCGTYPLAPSSYSMSSFSFTAPGCATTQVRVNYIAVGW